MAGGLPAGSESASPRILDGEITALLAIPSAIPHSSSASSLTLVNPSDGVSSDEAPLLKDIESTQSSTPDLKPDTPQTPDKPPRKPKKGWRDVPPFIVEKRCSRTSKRDWIAWSELTLREKYEYRRNFFLEYFSETRKCLPYVKKLFVTVYRISPWRATLLLFLNLVNGFLPALTLQTKGSFLILLQTGLEKGKLDTRELVKLLVNQIISNIIERVNEEILVNVNNYMKKQLARNLQARVLNGYLNLELDEMKDTYTGLFFNRASYVAKDSLSIFERQLGIFRDITSILTRIAALKNLASRKSWPILFLTALLPMLDTLLDKLFPGLKRRESVAPYESETDSERHGRHALRSLLQMSSTLKSRPEILIFGARDWILQKFHSTIHSINVSTDRESARSARRRAEYSGKWWELTTRLKQHFLPMTQGAARALLYLVVAYQPDYFGMPISQLTFVEGCVSDLFFSTTKLKNVISDKLVRDMFEVRNLFECVDYKSKSSSPANPREYVSRAGGMKVEVRGLSFAYREGKNVLKDVNFVIEPGQIVSIVGYNGSGKSTLIRLLTLIEKPSQGQILINDVDVTQYDAQIVRTKMSVLFQDFRKYEELSAFDNIAIGAGEPTVSLESVIESAKLVGIHPKIRTWHCYYDSRLQDDPESDGPDSDSDVNFDSDSDDDTPKDDEPPVPFMAKVFRHSMHDNAIVRGRKLKFRRVVPTDTSRLRAEIPPYDSAMDSDEEYLYTEWLSGGQWQKVAMARAFMRIREAELLILDEPSSALDPQAEYELFKNLMELRRGKTTIFISHRFHTVRAANKILLFDKGQLEEMGTHDELLDIEGGKYAHLFRLQSEGYATMNEGNHAEAEDPA